MTKIHNIGGTQPPKEQAPNVDIKSMPDVECSECGNKSFTQSFLLKKVSALLSESGKPGYYPIQVFSCTKCGHVNDEFNPLVISHE